MDLTAPSIFQDYLSSGLRYVHSSGPDKIHSLHDAHEKGLNCGALIHLLIQRLYGFTIRKELMCLEMFYDSDYFDDVTAQSGQYRQGDIFFFGRTDVHLDRDKPHPSVVNGQVSDWRQHPPLHLAMAVRDCSNGSTVLIHATNVRHHGVELKSLDDFLQIKRYAKLHGVRRLRAHFTGP